MKRICFICLGNICRSPMAEFMMKKKINDLNLSDEFYIVSRATSYEEEGNGIYPPAKRKLESMNIPISFHKSICLEKKDYNLYDYFICMEDRNISNAIRIFGNDKDNKIIKLLDKDIADPWYTDDFDTTYNDLEEGLNKLINSLTKKNND